jgi:hypothetical protein
MAYKKLIACKFCECSFENLNSSERANHTRWCHLNPKRNTYLIDLQDMRNSIPDSSRKQQSNSLKIAHITGKFDYSKCGDAFRGKTHSTESKLKMSRSALASPHRRLVKSVRKYTCKDGSIVQLDSSWEELLAKRLDELNIKWVRPNPIKWLDNSGTSRNYFPDFYLTDYDLYLDPKNPHAANIQQEKITWLTEHVKIIFLYSIQEINSFSL